MKMKQKSRKVTAWFLVMSLCLASFWISDGAAQAVDPDTKEAVTLGNPVIDAKEGKISWDCVYFGNYWQSRYIPQPGNQPEQGEDDVVHEDTDGTKYLVREDKTCYKYEPVKWRVLSVSEDGKEAVLMADKNLDVQSYHSGVGGDGITWENSDVRLWLNEEFLNRVFTDEEKEGILPATILNKKTPEYVKEEEEDVQDEVSTTDRIYLPSREEITSRAYGFTDDTEATETRQVENTEFAEAGGTAKYDNVSADYWLRTMAAKNLVSHVNYLDGSIPTTEIYVLLNRVNDYNRLRPLLHLDLTKTGIWRYAGKVMQDKMVIPPDATVSPASPTEKPTLQPQVTMAPGQIYPKNPVVNGVDLTKNIWDCIYFGLYFNTKVTPSVLSEAGEDNIVKVDEKNEFFLPRHEQGYFQQEPIKWRVLSINEDGSDAFLMADRVIDVAQYYHDGSMEITWEKSDVRQWLNGEFMEMSFTPDEQEAMKTTNVTTPDNQWSKEPGGNDTKDKIYLPSIEEMLDPVYGFSSDVAEGSTRKITVTDYADKGGTPCKPADGFMSYWLRSPGTRRGCPAQVGDWGEGKIQTESSVMLEKASSYLGIRPVLHVDLSNTALWTYAGQVTPKGVVVPEKPEPDITVQPDVTPQPVIPTPNTTVKPVISTQEPQLSEKEAKKPGRPAIKKLTNKKGKKVTLILSKKVAGATGYQVAYATKSSMKRQKTKSFKGTSLTVKGLKKKKTYYFRVRACVKKNGKTIYGSWSSKKSIKVKK